jgi:hypothetical protein
MSDFYLALLSVNLTVGGIAFAALFTLREWVVGVGGDGAVGLLLAGRTRVAGILLTVNALLCVLAALALLARPDFLPRWDPGVDVLFDSWLAGLLVVISTTIGVGLAALALLDASRLLSAPTMVAAVLGGWDQARLAVETSDATAVTVRDIAMRALHRDRPDDHFTVCLAVCRSLSKSIRMAPHRDDRWKTIDAVRRSVLMPIAEDAVRLGRFDEAAGVSRALREVYAQTGDLDLADRTELVRTSAGVRDLLLQHPTARRASASVIADIAGAAMSAADARAGDAFADACCELGPFAMLDPGTYLIRGSVIDIDRTDTEERPIEFLNATLERLSDDMWGPRGSFEPHWVSWRLE